MRTKKKHSKAYLAKPICLVKHFEGSSPPYITVKRNLQWVRNSTPNLCVLECLDALTRCLDLIMKSEIKDAR